MGRLLELRLANTHERRVALHGRMLVDAWRWAGDFRTSEIEQKAYWADEIALRVHHRLVEIHRFPNGNGWHSRLMADLLVMQLGRERFTGGSANLKDAGEVRRG